MPSRDLLDRTVLTAWRAALSPADTDPVASCNVRPLCEEEDDGGDAEDAEEGKERRCACAACDESMQCTF